MVTLIGKRKREDAIRQPTAFKKAATKPAVKVNGKPKSTSSSGGQPKPKPKDVSSGQAKSAASKPPPKAANGFHVGTAETAVSIQIVTGSYERTLHGISATIPARLLSRQAPTNGTKEQGSPDQDGADKVSFSDTFLFAAHTSAIRCIAVSPPTEAEKRFLATGSSDERINVYSISTAPPKVIDSLAKASLSGTRIAENASNKSLGSLIHHDRAVTRLHFPAKGKLFSAAEDNTIAISRTRDWTVLSSIKAPIPKAQGRPSGDTAAPGDVPAGVNDFAVHPSQKLMLSVGRGERCMRLWNLMTGKKAGVLNFERDLLAQVGEGKHSSGEGRRVLFDENGERYVVGFERGAALFDLESTPKGIIKPSPPTKLHQMRLLPKLADGVTNTLLATATEDGRILFHDIGEHEGSTSRSEKAVPTCTFVAQLGGKAAGVNGRIKDFQIISLPRDEEHAVSLIVTAGSDGSIRLWTVSAEELSQTSRADKGPQQLEVEQIGTMIGQLETGNRVTCMEAFLADGQQNNTEELSVDSPGAGALEESDDDSSDNDGR